MPGYDDGFRPVSSLRCALGFHKWSRPNEQARWQCQRCGGRLWRDRAYHLRPPLHTSPKEKPMPTAEWLLARIETALSTDQMWMLDALAITRAWSGQRG